MKEVQFQHNVKFGVAVCVVYVKYTMNGEDVCRTWQMQRQGTTRCDTSDCALCCMCVCKSSLEKQQQQFGIIFLHNCVKNGNKVFGVEV